MSNAEKTSLHSFAKSICASKTTIHRKAKELGIDTSNGLTEDDRARILEVLKPATGNTPNGSIVPSNGCLSAPESRLALLSQMVSNSEDLDVVDLHVAKLRQGDEILEVLEAEVSVLEVENETHEAEIQLLEQIRRQQELKFAELQARKAEADRRKHEIALKKAQLKGAGGKSLVS